MIVKVIKTEFEQKKRRVCAYVRVSTQSESQGASLDNQKKYFEEYYRQTSDIDFIGIYQDVGISGSKTERPGFQQMIDDCRQGKIDVIHTKSISRFARNTLLVLEVSQELKSLGVDIFFEEQNIHTLSNEGEMILSVLASLAEEELDSMSSNQRWAFQKKFQRGELLINTKRFLGYDLDESGELVINKKEAQIVRKIFSLYLDGYGMHRIAKLLNEENIPTVTKAKWHDTTIKNILRNEKYKGTLLLQKYFHDGVNGQKKLNKGEYEQYIIEENHPPIISKEVWEQVQELLLLRSHKQSANQRYALSGKLKCQYCGTTLKRQIGYKRKVFWICSKYIKEGKLACQGMRVPDEEVKHWGLNKPTTVIERIQDGQKYYSHSSQEDTTSREGNDSEKKQGSQLIVECPQTKTNSYQVMKTR